VPEAEQSLTTAERYMHSKRAGEQHSVPVYGQRAQDATNADERASVDVVLEIVRLTPMLRSPAACGSLCPDLLRPGHAPLPPPRPFPAGSGGGSRAGLPQIRKAIDQQHQRSTALVDVVETGAVDLSETMIEGLWIVFIAGLPPGRE
jgi:hypothetical protein